MKGIETRVYVGTYAKYNNGDLTGTWMALSDYDTYDDFLNACRELHSDENEPELMFQDIEGPDFGEYDESDCSRIFACVKACNAVTIRKLWKPSSGWDL